MVEVPLEADLLRPKSATRYPYRGMRRLMPSLSYRYHIAIISLSYRYHLAITSLSCRYHIAISSYRYHHIAIISLSSYRYHIAIISLSSRYPIAIMPLSYHLAIISLSYRYHIAIMPLSYRYHIAIISLSYRTFVVRLSNQGNDGLCRRSTAHRNMHLSAGPYLDTYWYFLSCFPADRRLVARELLAISRYSYGGVFFTAMDRNKILFAFSSPADGVMLDS